MGRPIEITRTEHSAAALRELAGRTQDGAVVRRLLGIALILGAALAMKRHGSAGWIGRHCAIGCIATTPMAWLG